MRLVEVVCPCRNRWKTRSFANRVGTAHEAVAVDAAERAGGAPVRALRTRRDQVERVVDARADDLCAEPSSSYKITSSYEVWQFYFYTRVEFTSDVNGERARSGFISG